MLKYALKEHKERNEKDRKTIDKELQKHFKKSSEKQRNNVGKAMRNNGKATKKLRRRNEKTFEKPRKTLQKR